METLGNILWIAMIVAVMGLVVKTIFFPKKNATNTSGGTFGGGGSDSSGGTDPRNQEPQ